MNKQKKKLVFEANKEYSLAEVLKIAGFKKDKTKQKKGGEK